MTTVSDIDWPALLALERDATAGPWGVDATGRVYDEDGVPLCDTRDDHGEPLGGQTREESQANAEFVAEVRGAFPALVAMVGGLAGALSDLSLAEVVCDNGDARLVAARQRARTALATIPAALREGERHGD